MSMAVGAIKATESKWGGISIESKMTGEDEEASRTSKEMVHISSFILFLIFCDATGLPIHDKKSI